VPGDELTRRQQIVRLLETDEWGFEELRRELQVSRQILDRELRHVQRSLKARGKKLEVEPPRCPECGLVLWGRETKRFHAPSRCPRCKSERIGAPRLSITE
jgi:predicted Zn-ribbon and HTH transcriptional regulator